MVNFSSFNNENNNQFLRSFLLEKWRERASQLGSPIPEDLSMACKFVSLFCFKLFGGELRGNYYHSYLFINNQIYDPTYPSNMFFDKFKDIDMWEYDPYSYHKDAYQKSIKYCEKRVDVWIEDFLKEYKK